MDELLLEPGEGEVLQPKHLDDRLASDVLVDRAGELPLGLLQLIVRPRRARREGAGAEHHERQRHHGHQSQAPLEHEEQRNVHREADQREQRIGETGRQALVNVCQVAREMRDDVPGLCTREEIHRQALEMAEHPEA